MAAKKTKRKKRASSNVVELRPAKKPRKKVKRKPKPKSKEPKVIFRQLSEFEAYKLHKSMGLHDILRMDLSDPKNVESLKERGVKTRRLDFEGRPLKKKRKPPSSHALQRRQFARRKKAAGKKTDFSPSAQAARVVAVVVSLDSRRKKKKT